MTGGAVSMEMVNGIVDMVNGKWGSGFRKVVKGYFHNKRENRKYEKNFWKERRNRYDSRKELDQKLDQ